MCITFGYSRWVVSCFLHVLHVVDEKEKVYYDFLKDKIELYVENVLHVAW